MCVRRVSEGGADELALGSVVVKDQATILTNLDVDPVTAWRMYNQGAAIEHRIEELAQLGVGKTAVDDIGGNHLLWSLGTLAYQLLHFARTVAMRRMAQVRTLRALVIRAPGKLIRHARRLQLKLTRQDAMTRTLLNAISRLRATAIVPVTAM